MVDNNDQTAYERGYRAAAETQKCNKQAHTPTPMAMTAARIDQLRAQNAALVAALLNLLADAERHGRGDSHAADVARATLAAATGDTNG